MRIENLRLETKQDMARAAAMVVWEDCERPAREVYFETPIEFAHDLICNPHSFLLASIMPAFRHGEARVAIDGEICPELRNGLETALGWMRHWFGSGHDIRIDSKSRMRLPSPRTPERVGSFLSGGLDSLATLRTNRLDFPLDHPASIKDGLIVYGFDMGGVESAGERPETFEQTLASLSCVAEDAQVTLVPVYTNVRHLDDDVHFWIYQFHGAALAAVAHAFSRRLTVGLIAAGFDIPNLMPSGTHPVLDSNYSSADLRLRHDGIRFSRFAKAKLVANWDVALQNLRACTMNPPGMLNCGKCEKCIRTMTELLAAGKLAQTQVFPVRDVSRELLETVVIKERYQEIYYRELLDPLRAINRLDLVEVIETKLAQANKYRMWAEEKDWKGSVKRLDRKYLAGSLFKSYKAMRARVRKA